MLLPELGLFTLDNTDFSRASSEQRISSSSFKGKTISSGKAALEDQS